MNPRVLQRRASDKAWQWAALFTLFALFSIPFYCITRQTWKPLVQVFACVASTASAWGLVIVLTEGVSGVSFQGDSVSELLLYLGCLVAIYIGGYLSVRDLKRNAINFARVRANEGTDSGDSIEITEINSFGIKRQLILSGTAASQQRIIGAAVAVMLAIIISGYAVHTFTVEGMIMQNPVVAAVAATGTKIKIKHFNCEGMYGYYEVASDTMQICTAAHDNQLETSMESTIRHEAWHVVQACASAKNDGEWGNLAVLSPPSLLNAKLSDDDEELIRASYPMEEWNTEREARLAELFMTDRIVVKYLEDYCYWE